MKSFLTTLGAVLLLSALTLAQATQPAPQNPPPANTPAAPPQGAEAPKTAKVPEAKTQEEFAAYQAAVGQADIAAAETAADEFAKKYPDSELRTDMYTRIMQKYYQSNNPEKVVQIGRKILAIDPNNNMALVISATALAETSKETDLDRDEKFAEAIKYADAAIKGMDSMLPPPNVAAEQFSALKNLLLSMAFSSKGYIEMSRKNYPASEENFQKAVDINTSQPDPTLFLRLAVTQDNQKKYAPALANTNKAIQLAESQGNTAVANLGKGERDRLNKLMGAPAAAKPATTPPPPPKQ
jgi:tetratricopeptide (TPR) repeat protein